MPELKFNEEGVLFNPFGLLRKDEIHHAMFRYIAHCDRLFHINSPGLSVLNQNIHTALVGMVKMCIRDRPHTPLRGLLKKAPKNPKNV